MPLFQAFLTKIWWGDMASDTPVLRLLGAFLCPVLLYTNLITFRSVGGRGGGGSPCARHAQPAPAASGLHSPAGPEGALCSQRGPTEDGPGGPTGAGRPGHGEEPALQPGQRVRATAWETAAEARPQGGTWPPRHPRPWPPLRCRADAPAEAPRTAGPRGPFLLARWRQFWGAPVTVFLGNVVMYFAFLFLFTYVLLVDFRPPPQGPSGPEVTLYFWVFTLVLEEVRQVSGGRSPAGAQRGGGPLGAAHTPGPARASSRTRTRTCSRRSRSTWGTTGTSATWWPSPCSSSGSPAGLWAAPGARAPALLSRRRPPSPPCPTGCCPRPSRPAARCWPWTSWSSRSASSTSLPSTSSWAPRSSSWSGWCAPRPGGGGCGAPRPQGRR